MKGPVTELIGPTYFRIGESDPGGREEKALNSFEEALKSLAGNSVWLGITHLEIGNLHRRWGRVKEAEKSYRTAYTLSKDDQIRNAARECLTAGGPLTRWSLKMTDERRIPSTIQDMNESDLDEILRIEASSGWTSWSRQSFLEEMKGLHSRCFTLRTWHGDKDSLIGFICFRMVEGESELLNLAIHPDYRQKGLGRELMQFYIDFCRQQR